MAVDTILQCNTLKSVHEHAKMDFEGVLLPEVATGKPMQTTVKESGQAEMTAKSAT